MKTLKPGLISKLFESIEKNLCIFDEENCISFKIVSFGADDY